MQPLDRPAHDREPRDRLALALDVDDLVAATRLADELRPWFGVAKVGLELWAAAGPEALVALTDRGYKVFLDLKLHDIPTTVGRAARVLGALGASYVTMHASGGAAMLRAGVDGLTDGAQSADLPAPVALAVTVLTSDTEAPESTMAQRIGWAIEAGCGGLVCAAGEVHFAKELAPHLIAVVPGIRLGGSPTHDQARAATPQEAVANGADVLVIGRTVTGASDRAAAAAALVDALT
jgi:orotidine-5'-phosphate decarboxylase